MTGHPTADEILANIRRLQAATAHIPRVERITVHPDSLEEFKNLFHAGPNTWKGILIPLGIPILADDTVPLGTIRVRENGTDTDVQLPPRPPGPRFVVAQPGEYGWRD